MRLLLALLPALLLAAPAQAAFTPAETVPAEPSGFGTSVVVGDRSGALLAVTGGARSVVVRDRPPAGPFGGPQELLPGRAFAVEAALGGGTALVGLSGQDGTVLLERRGSGAFGPPTALGGPGTRVLAVALDGAGNAAVLVGQGEFGPNGRVELRVRPAGGALGAPVVVSATAGTAELALGPGGRLAVVTVVRDANFRSVRVEARKGSVRDGLGPARVLSRAGGEVNVFDPGVAFRADGTAVAVFSTLRSPGRTFVEDVRVASAAPGRAFGAARILAADGARSPKVAAGGPTVAVAWTSTNPRPGRAGVRVALRRADGSFGPALVASPPERGFGRGPGGRPTPGATESRATASALAVSERGDVAVGYGFGPGFGPAGAFAAVLPRGARRFDGPQVLSPLGVSVQPGPPLWAGNGTLRVPFTGQRGSAGASALLGVAERPAGSAPAPAPRDRTAPRVTATEPTLTDLRAGLLATTLRCSEACAFTVRSQINVGGDIAKPRGAIVSTLRPGGSLRVALPLQESQRRGLASGARVRAIISFSVVDRLGNATTTRARICIPRRASC